MLRRNEMVSAVVDVLHAKDYWTDGQQYNKHAIAEKIVETILRLQQPSDPVQSFESEYDA